jgi:hypothetical protein
MIGMFNWYECRAITETQKGEVELKLVGTLLSHLVGNIKCSYGKPYCKINGTNDASKVKYERVD